MSHPGIDGLLFIKRPSALLQEPKRSHFSTLMKSMFGPGPGFPKCTCSFSESALDCSKFSGPWFLSPVLNYTNSFAAGPIGFGPWIPALTRNRPMIWNLRIRNTSFCLHHKNLVAGVLSETIDGNDSYSTVRWNAVDDFWTRSPRISTFSSLLRIYL